MQKPNLFIDYKLLDRTFPYVAGKFRISLSGKLNTQIPFAPWRDNLDFYKVMLHFQLTKWTYSLIVKAHWCYKYHNCVDK